MTLLAALGAYLVAEVLTLSAGYKVLKPGEYRQALGSYERLRHLPPTLLGFLAVAAPVAEIVTASLIYPAPTRLAGLAAAFAVLLTFYVLVGSDERQVIANCGCWGRAAVSIPRRVVMARNLMLMVIGGGALLAMLTGAAGRSVEVGGSHVLGALAVAGMVLPFALFILEMPELVMLGRLGRTESA